MSFYEKENLFIQKFQTVKLYASFYRPKNRELKATILYFHGGGFIFGNRNDLPKQYLDLFAQHGIGLLVVDYPLAPETKLSYIIKSTKEITDWFINQFLLDIKNDHYFIMGRSAGGFLALTNGVHANHLSKKPLGIVSLYGYFNLNDASFSVPSRYYLKYPSISERIVNSLIKKEPVVTDLNQNRFPIYLASRQKGNWMNLVLTSLNQKHEFTLSSKKIRELPNLFIATATQDPDVPARQSRQLANIHPKNTLRLLELDEHDFDRTHIKEFGLPLYEEIVQWMLKLST